MVRWTVAGAIALIAFLAFGALLVDHPDVVRRYREHLTPVMDVVPP